MGAKFNADIPIEAIRRDRIHGSSWLSNAALRVLRSVAEDEHAEDSSQLHSILRNTAKKLINTHPNMASLTNVVAELLYEIEGEGSMPLSELRLFASERAKKLIEDSEMSLKRAAANAARLIEGKSSIITFSYSSTVLEALSLRPDAEVIVPESRPLFEGRELARDLAGKVARVTLITDAAIAYFTGEAEVALVGADSVLSEGSIVNKVGTRLLALSARDKGIPFYAVCETSKFDVRSLLGTAPVLEEKDSSEVAELLGIESRNPYFEVTPARLINALVTEAGVMDVSAIRKQMEGMRRYVEPLVAK